MGDIPFKVTLPFCTSDSFLGFSTPKKPWLDEWPKNVMPEKFGENVSRVVNSINMEEPNDVGSNCFSDAMVGQCVVTLVQGGMRDSPACDDTLIISKHVGLSIQRGS